MAMTYSKLSPLPTAASLSSCSTLTPASATRIEPPSLDPASSSSRSRRLPKAPVFINKKPTEPNTITSFITETDGATEQPASIQMEEPEDVVETRVYDYDDDFPSIAASESTAPPPVEGPLARRARERVRRRDLNPPVTTHKSAPITSPTATATSTDSCSAPAPASASASTSATITAPPHLNVAPHQDWPGSTSRDRSRSRSRASRSRARSRSRRRGHFVVDDDDDSQLLRRRRLRDMDDDFVRQVSAAARRGPRASAGSRAEEVVGCMGGGGGGNGVGCPAYADRPPPEGAPGIHYSRTAKMSFANADRVSFASSIRRRVSLHYSRTRPDGTPMGPTPRRSYGGQRAHHLEDSILHDWRESRMKEAAEAAESVSGTSVGATGTGRRQDMGRRGGFFQGLFVKADRRTPEIDSITDRMRRMDSETDGEICKALVEDRKKKEEMQFMSTLAYDDFMHGQSHRTSAASRVFSRLRRS